MLWALLFAVAGVYLIQEDFPSVDRIFWDDETVFPEATTVSESDQALFDIPDPDIIPQINYFDDLSNWIKDFGNKENTLGLDDKIIAIAVLGILVWGIKKT